MPKAASGKPRTGQIKRKQANGDVYVYEVTSLYNPEKRYNEHISSKLIGKIPAGSTEMIPTRPKKASDQESCTAERKRVGTTDILKWIGTKSGIDEDLYTATDKGTAQKLISIARYWTSNPDKSIHRIEEWQIDHTIPYEEGLSEDSCYLLMDHLGKDVSTQQNYFRQRASRSASRASVAVDSTTIYSYSDHLNDVRYGYNKDKNRLPTVKLLTLYGLEDHQPIAFTRQPGNIPDVSSVLNAIRQFSVLEMNKPRVVLDGGFFSEPNLLALTHAHMKYLVRGQIDCSWIHPELDSIRTEFALPSSICQDYPEVSGVMKRIDHVFYSERKRTTSSAEKGTLLPEEHRLYLFFFLDADKARIEKNALMKDILHVKKELENGVDPSLLSHTEQKLSEKFLLIRTRKNKIVSVLLNDDAILKEVEDYGIFVLVGNEPMTKDEALHEYRLRERTEEGFRIDKEFNDAHTTRAKLGSSLDGRFLCQFVALGYESFFMKELNRVKRSLAVPNGNPEHDNSKTFKKEKELLRWLKTMTVAKIFDWFDVVQETTVNTSYGKARWRTETIERDRLFLQRLGVIREV